MDPPSSITTPPPPPPPSQSSQQSPLRCVHCHTTETPLWRAGPSGPKTLCNACGVRWKKTGSVIARAKRSQPQPQIRKRARPSTPPPPSSPAPQQEQLPSGPNFQRQLVVPKPISVYRIADVSKGKYESVFTGLMSVNRKQEEGNNRRTRTHTDKAHAFFTELASSSVSSPQPTVPTLSQKAGSGETVVSPCSTAKADEGAVYVTEVHAPSPSPSPPPMPRVRRGGGATGFTLLLASVADKQKVDGVGFRDATTGDH